MLKPRCGWFAPGLVALVLLCATRPARLTAERLAALGLDGFQTGSGLVTTAVTVRERNGGKLVSNLTEHDFVVQEDGKPQPLARFTSERTPLSVAVVVIRT